MGLPAVHAAPLWGHWRSRLWTLGSKGRRVHGPRGKLRRLGRAAGGAARWHHSPRPTHASHPTPAATLGCRLPAAPSSWACWALQPRRRRRRSCCCWASAWAPRCSTCCMWSPAPPRCAPLPPPNPHPTPTPPHPHTHSHPPHPTPPPNPPFHPIPHHTTRLYALLPSYLAWVQVAAAVARVPGPAPPTPICAPQPAALHAKLPTPAVSAPGLYRRSCSSGTRWRVQRARATRVSDWRACAPAGMARRWGRQGVMRAPSTGWHQRDPPGVGWGQPQPGETT